MQEMSEQGLSRSAESKGPERRGQPSGLQNESQESDRFPGNLLWMLFSEFDINIYRQARTKPFY